MIRFLAVVLAIMLASLMGRLSRGAEAVIKAPSVAPACSYFLLDASTSEASRRVAWRLTDADSDVAVFRSGDGRQIVLHVPSPRTLCVTLLAIDSDNLTDTQTVCVRVTGDVVPAPTPGPPIPSPVVPTPVIPVTPVNPVRPVEPDLPQGQFGLTKAARDEARKLLHATRGREVPKVVEQLEKLKARIQSGEVNVTSLLSLKSGLDKLQKENKEALGASVTAWAPWGTWWANAMKALYFANRLATAADWIQAIEETINGLKAV